MKTGVKGKGFGGTWMLEQVVYTLGILGSSCMEFEGAPIPSFRMRWEVERRRDTH